MACLLSTIFKSLDVVTSEIIKSKDVALNINSLPDEMLINIFSYLPHNKLVQPARVCRRWNVLTKSPVLWKNVNVIFCPPQGSHETVVRNFLSLLPRVVTCIRIDFKTGGWAKPLNFEEICVNLQRRCPHLKMLLLKDAIVSESLPSVIDLCTNFLQNVKILIFLQSTFLHFPEREVSVDSKIEVLHLYKCYSRYLENPPFSRMAYLKQLRLPGTAVGDSWLESYISLNQLHVLDMGRTRIGSREFQAIRHHGLNLKELYLCGQYIEDNDLKFNNTVFPHLKTICLMGCYPVTCEGVVSLIQSCQSLKNVYVTQTVAALYAAHPFINANKCKLEIVKGTNVCYKHGGKVDYL